MDGWIDDGMNDRRRMWGMYYDLMMEMALVVTALCVLGLPKNNYYLYNNVRGGSRISPSIFRGEIPQPKSTSI